MVVPILKKGDLICRDNYRGILIINAIARIFLKIVIARVNRMVGDCSLNSKFQAKFVKSEEAIVQFVCSNEITRTWYEKKGKYIYMFYKF